MESPSTHTSRCLTRFVVHGDFCIKNSFRPHIIIPAVNNMLQQAAKMQKEVRTLQIIRDLPPQHKLVTTRLKKGAQRSHHGVQPNHHLTIIGSFTSDIPRRCPPPSFLTGMSIFAPNESTITEGPSGEACVHQLGTGQGHHRHLYSQLSSYS